MNNPLEVFHESWYPILGLMYKEPLKHLSDNVLPEISFQPKREDIFNVFSMPVTDIKVVILGQDPYPKPGDAIGYSFATIKERKTPKSLQIIQKEIINNETLSVKLGDHVSISESIKPYRKHLQMKDEQWKTLDHWRKQGVFLLNSALTVETGKAGSHLKYWEEFTKRVISFIAETQPCVWLFWGKKSQEYVSYINNNPFFVKNYDVDTIKDIPSNNEWNYILQSAHPAAEAYGGGKAGFYGCNHFKYANTILRKTKSMQITW